MKPARIAVAGAGLIGRRHVEVLQSSPKTRLASIIDPAPEARALAAQRGVAWFGSLSQALSNDVPEGVILATPNQHHSEGALACIAAGVPVLVEKPIATDVDQARRLVTAGERAGVAVLIGHHRRHNPLVAAALARIKAADLGRIVAVHGMFWVAKPDAYFDVGWRSEPGGGPVYLNLIHDIDLMRCLVGEITSVRAIESNSVRGKAVEDTAALLITFDNGALGTFSVSDAIVSPWSWELTARENPAYPATGESCLWIGGTRGALTLPDAVLWSDGQRCDWWQAISRSSSPMSHQGSDPLLAQVENFAEVIRGLSHPVVSGREGLRTLAVIEAVKRAAASGEVEIPAP